MNPARRTASSRGRGRGVSPLEEAYDRLLDDDGQAMMLALANFENNSLDTVGICCVATTWCWAWETAARTTE